MRGDVGVGVVVTVKRGELEEALDPRRDLRNHSEAFEWGYAGSGPCQLALAIVADLFADDELALLAYQTFKRAYIVGLEPGAFELTAAEARAILRQAGA